MLDGNVLLRQKRDEVPEGTLSCPDRNLAVFHHYRHYEGLRLLPSVCDSKLIQQTLINPKQKTRKAKIRKVYIYNKHPYRINIVRTPNFLFATFDTSKFWVFRKRQFCHLHIIMYAHARKHYKI